jgi:predicted nucleotidyltransferase
VLEEMGTSAAALPHPPVSAIVFGSFARREAGTDSDIDVVVVRPAGVDEDEWSESLEAWRRGIQRLTGNPVEVLEVGADEAAAKLRSRSPVWVDIRRDGRVVHGLGLEELRGVPNA